MKQKFWLIGLFNIFISLILTALLAVLIVFLLFCLNKISDIGLLNKEYIVFPIVFVFSFICSLIISNGLSSILFLKIRLKNNTLWMFSFITGFYLTIEFSVLAVLFERNFTWIFDTINLVSFLSGAIASVLFFTLLNANGILLANRIFKIQHKLEKKRSLSIQVIDS